MNVKKSAKKSFSISELVLLGMAAVIMAAGGIMHVYASNKEIETVRKIDTLQKDVDEYYADVNMINVKIYRNLDRYLMKEDLLARGSDLRATDPSQLEIVDTTLRTPEKLAVTSATSGYSP